MEDRFEELARAVLGKRVVRVVTGPDGFDLEFDDGTIIELYDVGGYVITSRKEVEKYEKLNQE
ncbi:hypothetical protein [Thermococcus barophilus]|uniref:Uncharacterized protein n=1 Tax=Thermococcus barophilus (strain DSM 11836 / MP) TaxID=391623 RepID=F0LN57_THEBM|nr:hypothetical protein [Thermococcus barophilus]ADT85196.1 hypothetical protein TERMP_02223 [Thermococcus barophilus MP]